MTTRVAILPPVPALLPDYLGRVDPIIKLREACRTAVSWLVDGCGSPVIVLADEPDAVTRSRGVDVPLGVRVAHCLLEEATYRQELRHGDAAGPGDRRLLVLANGSACRRERAPGHLDPRSFAFDELIENALADGDPESLASLDTEVGRDLLAAGIEPLRRLGSLRPCVEAANLLYADDPYGVRYWVATWLCTSSG